MAASDQSVGVERVQIEDTEEETKAQSSLYTLEGNCACVLNIAWVSTYSHVIV